MEDVKTAPTVVDGMTERQIKALYCLNILQLMAVQRQTVHYETLAIMLGLPTRGNAMANAVSLVLRDVFSFCIRAGLPPLTVLVVRKRGTDKGIPGPGFWKLYFPDTVPDLETRVSVTERETARCFELFSHL